MYTPRGDCQKGTLTVRWWAISLCDFARQGLLFDNLVIQQQVILPQGIHHPVTECSEPRPGCGKN
jgi:hypothetical protein